MPNELNVYQKLNILKSVARYFKKTKKGHGFNYAATDQILAKILDKELEIGILHTLVNTEPRSRETYDYKSKEGILHHDLLIDGYATWAWVNTDKPSDKIEIQMEYYGQQEDLSQAYGSALTYSERYFLTKTLGIPTTESDPDNTKGFSEKTQGEPTMSQYDRILQMLRKTRYTLQDVNVIMKAKLNVTKKINELTPQEFETLQNEIAAQLLNENNG